MDMNYVTIADLKKMAKKERKNNNNIKNHAESLNIIANMNNFSSWSDLIDNSVLLKSNNALSEKEKKDILSNVVDNIIIKLHEIKSIFSTNNPEVLSTYMNNNFLDAFDSKKEDMWANRAREFMETLCFVYVNSNLERNIYNFKEILPFANCLAIIEDKKLLNDIKVKRLFELVMYEYKPQEPIPDNVLEQYGFLAMQYIIHFGFIDNIMKVFGKDLEKSKKQIKDIILKNYNLLLYKYSVNDVNMLDPTKLFLKYRNSFNTESEFLLDLKRNLV